jgi:acyl-lipid omega-6 desaturase (Delta-12 desaturase)
MTNFVETKLKTKNVTIGMIEAHIENYKANNTKGFITIFTTILMLIALYASYFYIPYKVYWPIWVFLRAGWFIRVYIFFHDCTHGSFFTNQTWN